MAMQQCTSCNIDLAEDPSRGELFCPRCGEVFEENRVVAEIGFQESGGSVAVVGQRIPTGSDSARAGQSSESREASLAKGNAKIEWVGQLLKLSNHIQEAAKRIFLLAVQRNFTKGRRTVHVAAACLYVQCRLNRTPHMLIDFSDVLQASVRVLGQCYMKLTRLLNLDNQVVVPLIDPSFFMERFASQMNFGNMQQKVALTAVRMVQAMKRDWIVTGRRPTGLCGAALMISAQYHGFERSAVEIGDIVRMGEITLKKRLFEFRQTSTAALTTEEFEKLDWRPAETWDFKSMPITDALPPSLVKNRHKEVKLQQLADQQEQLQLQDAQAAASSSSAAIKNEDVKAEDVKVPVPLALEDGSAKEELKAEPPAINIKAPIVLDSLNDKNFEEPNANDIENIAKNMQEMLAQRAATSSTKVKKEQEEVVLKLEDGTIEGVVEDPSSSPSASASASVPIKKSPQASPSNSKNEEVAPKRERRAQKRKIKEEEQASASSQPVKTEEEQGKAVDPALKASVDHLLNNMPDIYDIEQPPPRVKKNPFEISHITGNVLPQVKGEIVVKNAVKAEDVVEDNEDAATETLSEVDDAELDQYLLADSEMRAKADIWHEVNRDFLAEWEVREQNRQNKKQESGVPKKRRVQQPKLQPASNPLEGVQAALERKGLSSRIDADALEDLFNLH